MCGVIGERAAREMSAIERWAHTADPLHFGNFVGLAAQLIWTIFGMPLTGLCATGVIIFTKRAAQAARPLR